DLLTSLNAIKVDIDQVQKTSQILSGKKSIDSSGTIAADLSSLQERHRKTVMTVLVALERLENALPLAQKLNALLIELNEKVASVEEVNDYLETADCPVSRKDMLQIFITRPDIFQFYQISRSQTNAKNILHHIQLAESRTDKLVNCLKAMEPMLYERTNMDLLKTDEPALFAEWTKQLDETEAYLAQLVEENKQMSTDRGSLLLKQKLEACKTQLQERLTSVRRLWSQLTQSSNLESQFTKIRRELADIENKTYLLDIVSTNANDIQTSLEKTKVRIFDIFD
ncbi:hypothetical protein AHF37_11083, partial [Paragonimus kellicotti]